MQETHFRRFVFANLWHVGSKATILSQSLFLFSRPVKTQMIPTLTFKVPGQSLTWGQRSGQVEVRYAASCDLEWWGKRKYDGAIYISNHAWLKMYKQKLISFRFITEHVKHLIDLRLRMGNPKQTFHMFASLYPTLSVSNHSDKNCFHSAIWTFDGVLR